MKRFLGTAVIATLFSSLVAPAHAAEADTSAIVDKAIKAVGGEERLARAKVLSWKTKGTITFGENTTEVSMSTIAQGFDRARAEVEGDFNGRVAQRITVLNDDKAWIKFGDNITELNTDVLAHTKRMIYLQVIPTTLVGLKGNGFKIESLPDESVDDAPADVIQVTAPDGKDFKLLFDKKTSLPVKLVAKVVGANNQEMMQEVKYSAFKDFDGIKRATKVQSKRDGMPFLDAEITEFKVLEKVDPDTFAEPK
jgi:hypothetical protein